VVSLRRIYGEIAHAMAKLKKCVVHGIENNEKKIEQVDRSMSHCCRMPRNKKRKRRLSGNSFKRQARDIAIDICANDLLLNII